MVIMKDLTSITMLLNFILEEYALLIEEKTVMIGMQTQTMILSMVA